MSTFAVLIEQDEDDVYIAYVPSLPGCHTQGRTIPEVEERIKEAISLYIEVARERGQPIQPSRFVGAHQVEVA
jgi:predicted RNase H-like HicB family nuclease